MKIEINKFKNANNSIKIDVLKFDGEMSDLDKILTRLTGEETIDDNDDDGIRKEDVDIAWDEYYKTGTDEDDRKGSELRNGGIIKFKDLKNLRYKLIINDTVQDLEFPAYMSKEGFCKFMITEIILAINNGSFKIKGECENSQASSSESTSQAKNIIGFNITDFSSNSTDDEEEIDPHKICIDTIYEAYDISNSDTPYDKQEKKYLMDTFSVGFINIGNSYKQLIFDGNLLCVVVPNSLTKESFIKEYRAVIVDAIVEKVERKCKFEGVDDEIIED